MRDFLNRILDFFSPEDTDFGEFGILVRDDAGNMVPMDQDYFDKMEAETTEAMEEHWLTLEAEAFETHGPGIMQVH